MHDVVTTAIALVIGLATGYFFERRSTNEAKRRGEELAAELEHVNQELTKFRHGLLSVGGQVDRSHVPSDRHRDVTAELRARALSIQDPGGLVSRQLLASHFLQQGMSRKAIDESIQALVEAGNFREDGRSLRVVS